MSAYIRRMLLVQGYQSRDVFYNDHLNLLARWTPFACGCCGTLGLGLRSPFYFWILGALTLVGSMSSRSIYDYVYQALLRPFTALGDMPRHGAPRRFGCAIGAVLFVLSGWGCYLNRPLLALIPALIIVPLAFGAAITQWCFASALYRLLLRRNEDCC